MRPARSSSTCCAAVGEGLVLAFAEGAASGALASLIRDRARAEAGMRHPKVGRPAVTSGAKREEGEGLGRRMVSGPGQKRVMRGW